MTSRRINPSNGLSNLARERRASALSLRVRSVMSHKDLRHDALYTKNSHVTSRGAL